MATISDIILQQGRDLANSRRAKGRVIGDVASSLSNVPNQIYADRAAERARSLAEQEQSQRMAVNQQRLTAGQGELDDAALVRQRQNHLRQIAAAPGTWNAEKGEWNIPAVAAFAHTIGADDEVPELQKSNDERYAEQLKQAAVQANTAKTKAETEKLLHPPAEPFTLGEGQVRYGADGQQVASGPPKPDTRSPFEQLNAAAKVGNWLEYARIKKTIADNAQASHVTDPETARHNRALELAANPFGGIVSQAGGAASTGARPTGDDFLKTLPPNIASEVKAYAEGKRPFPVGMSQAKMEPLIQLVGQYDPTFDAANYNARNKARTDLTSPSGTGGKAINSLNTAIAHVGTLSDLIEALGNNNIPAANYVANIFSKGLGSTKVTNFEAVQPQMMKEIERLWRGAGGSQGDIDALKSSLSKNMGIQQQREALDQFVSLIEGKLQSTEEQRNNILGPVVSQQVPVLFEKNKTVLTKVRDRASGSAAPVKTQKIGRFDVEVAP